MKKNGKLESSPQSARAGCSETVHQLAQEKDWALGSNVNSWMA